MEVAVTVMTKPAVGVGIGVSNMNCPASVGVGVATCGGTVLGDGLKGGVAVGVGVPKIVTITAERTPRSLSEMTSACSNCERTSAGALAANVLSIAARWATVLSSSSARV